MAVTSSLDGSHASPRTPIVARPHSNRLGLEDDGEDVELNLLNEDERLRAREGLEPASDEISEKRPISGKDKRAMVLLSILCGFSVHSLPCTCRLNAVHEKIRPYSGCASKQSHHDYPVGFILNAIGICGG